MSDTGEPYFLEQVDGSYLPTIHTQGPWAPADQHGAPPMALLAHILDEKFPPGGKLASRFSFDILGPVRIAPFTVEVSMDRDGRNICLLSATLKQAGRIAMMAHVWRISADFRVGPQGGEDESMKGRFVPPVQGGESAAAEALPPQQGIATFGYGRASDWVFASGSFSDPGPALVWNRVQRPLLGDVYGSGTERALLLADAGSGVGAALAWDRFSFPNVDLTMHLARPPKGEWLGLDARTWIGGSGSGMAVSALVDIDGRFGTVCQSLYVRQRE